MKLEHPTPTDREESDRRSPDGIYAVAVAGPPLALGVATVLVLALAIPGRDPVWSVSEMTISESAALADRGAVVRMISAGLDPNSRYPVRSEVLASSTLVMTPIEAAALNRRVEMVQLLLEHGATLRDTERHRLMCHLYRGAFEASYVFLAGFGLPSEPPIDCTGHEPYW